MKFYFLVVFFYCQTLFSQSVLFENITTVSGLSNNSINCIESAKNGDLWIGTWDGLNLYDGKKIINFKHNPLHNNSIAGNNIISLLIDKNNFLWILTDSKYISRLDENFKFVHYELNEIPAHLQLDLNGNLVVFTNKDNAFIFKDQHFIKTKAIKTTNHIPQDLKVFLFSLNYTSDINFVLKQQENFFWVATQNNGLFYVESLKGNRFKILEHYQSDQYNPYGLASNEITVLHKDKYNNIWLGLKDGGISRMIDKSKTVELIFAHHQFQPFLINQTIRAITLDNQSNIWLGYYSEGIFTKQKNSSVFTPYLLQQAKQNKDWNRVRSLYSDSNENIWVGTYGGVVRITGEKQFYYTKETTENFHSNRTYSFCQDNNQRLWVGAWQGLSMFNLKTLRFEPFLNQESFKKYNIRKIIHNQSTLYLATEKHGLVLYDINSGLIKNIDQSNGLIGNSVYDIYIDNINAEIWVASLGGITILNFDQTLKDVLTEQQGLPSHLVYSLNAVDNAVWISTTKGVASVDRQSKKVLDYSNYVGWQGVEFAEGAHFKDKTAMLYYGGNKGLNFFNPQKVFNAQDSLEFKLFINNKLIAPENTLEFAYKNNNLTLELYPLGYLNFANNQFEYKINGLFDPWRVLPKEVVSLDDLSFGDYLIQVRDATKKEPNIIFEKQLTIKKPFYLQVYFIALWGCFLIIILFVILKIKRRKILATQIYLQELVQANTTQINLQKTELENKNKELIQLYNQTISQKAELFTLHSKVKNDDIEMEKFRVYLLDKLKQPLLLILNHCDRPNCDLELKKQVCSLYNMVREWNFLEQIKNSGTNELINVEIRIFMQRLISEFNYLPNKYDVKIEFKNGLSPLWVVIDALSLKMLIHYLINESCKFISQQDMLKLEFKNTDTNLIITINSKSETLSRFWDENLKYSPYYRAVKVLLKLLKGELSYDVTKEFNLKITIPILLDTSLDNSSCQIKLNELQQDLKVLPKDKLNLIVLADANDFIIVKQLFTSFDNCNIIYLSGVNETVNNLKHYSFDALLIYNNSLKDNLKNLFAQIKNLISKRELLVFYLSQEVDYIFQEQLFELGVNDLLHFPISKDLIKTRIIKPIENSKVTSRIALFQNLSQSNNLHIHISNDEKLVRKALELIDKNLSESEFGVEQLCHEIGISKMKCYRLFKEFLDKSPLEIMIETRMRKAEYLLNNSNLRVAEISFECGYNDPKHFSKTFKKFFKVSPSDFQKV